MSTKNDQRDILKVMGDIEFWEAIVSLIEYQLNDLDAQLSDENRAVIEIELTEAQERLSLWKSIYKDMTGKGWDQRLDNIPF